MKRSFGINNTMSDVQDEMNSVRNEALTKLESTGIHPKYLNDLARILSYAKDHIPESEKMINEFGLQDYHFFAIDENVDGFLKEMSYLEELAVSDNYDMRRVDGY